MKKLIGKVIANDDPTRHGRCKIECRGWNDGLSTDEQEWIEQSSTLQLNGLTIPAIGQWVEIALSQNSLSWQFLDLKDQALIDIIGDEYLQSQSVFMRNLSELNSDQGLLGMIWTESKGLEIFKSDSKIQLNKDGDVILDNSKRQISIVDDIIYLGGNASAKEWGALGETNSEALQILADNHDELSTAITAGLSSISAIAKANPYTLALGAPIDLLIQTIDALAIAQKTRIDLKIPTTISKVVKTD